MQEYLPEIITALGGMVAAGIPGYIAWLKLQEFKVHELQMERELRFQRVALDFPKFIEQWGAISTDLQTLMRNTPVDRFLILRAWNGLLTPRWTTAVYQMRYDGKEPISYVHFELDNDYINRLREISTNGHMSFKVSDIPDSFIKEVYTSEGVQSAIWSHLETLQVDDSESRAITYCSFASTTEDTLDADTLLKCKLIANRLQGIALSFEP